MFSINKSFDFCYGHRIWNQQLPDNQTCKCKRLHEHESCVEVNLHSPTLTNGMVLDFNLLKPVKKFIDDVIDHHFLMDINDPLLETWLKLNNLSFEDLMYVEDYWKVDLEYSGLLFTCEITEWLDSLVVVDFVPSSEELSKWLCYQVRDRLELGKDVSVGITWHESAKSCASYVVHP